jgi:hypothetical protein
MEELKNDISYATRNSLINFDNDAASCYDQIIPALTSLLGQSYGLHQNVIYVNARTLKKARYKLRTLTGISEDYYSHYQAFPIFKCHEEQSHGATFCSPIKPSNENLLMNRGRK